MPYIPHNAEDTEAMLKALGLKADDLFQEIPASLKSNDWAGLPDALDEVTLCIWQKSSKPCAAFVSRRWRL